MAGILVIIGLAILTVCVLIVAIMYRRHLRSFALSIVLFIIAAVAVYFIPITTAGNSQVLTVLLVLANGLCLTMFTLENIKSRIRRKNSRRDDSSPRSSRAPQREVPVDRTVPREIFPNPYAEDEEVIAPPPPAPSAFDSFFTEGEFPADNGEPDDGPKVNP